MKTHDKSLSTEQKALEINLDPRRYGTIVEIGAGQEVARQFFKAGAAAGTVAKTMSAYDMRVSDEIYGQVGRYVSRERLEQMLSREFDLVLERLQSTRPKDSTFFSYAATVAAKGYKTSHECHGWIGVRVQLRPNETPCEIIMHVRMLDNENHLQSEALGILGVNLIHGAFTHDDEPKKLIDGLKDGLGEDRIEIDLIHFAGPGFQHIDNRLMNLHLIRAWLTRVVMYLPDGTSVVPGEELYKHPSLVIRGAFNPPTKAHVDMAQSGLGQLQKTAGKTEDAITMAEISMANLITGGEVDDEEFLTRVDLVAALGYHVLVSDYLRMFSLRSWIRRYTQKPIGIVAKSTDINYLFDESYYEGLEGGILEAMGKLFADDTRMFVYPSADADGNLVTLDNFPVPEHLKLLLEHLRSNHHIEPSEEVVEQHIHYSFENWLKQIREGRGDWEDQVPEAVRDIIVERKLFGFPG